MSRRTLTPEQAIKRDERKAKFAAIVQQIADMPEDQRAALAARMQVVNCNGHTLSPRNQMLIAMQLGTHCTIVGGFKQWLKQGRCVQKGQTGATILFPRTFGDKNSPDNATAASETAAIAESKNGKKSPVRFLSGTVFDISQTAEIDGQTCHPFKTKGEVITDLTDAADRERTDPMLADNQHDRDAILDARAEQIYQDAAARVAQPGYDPRHEHAKAQADKVGKITRTIWDENPNNEPVLITAPTPEQRAAYGTRKKKPSLMNQPPPGGWTDADKVPAHQRKGSAIPEYHGTPREAKAQTIPAGKHAPTVAPITCIHCERKAVTVDEGIAFCFLHAPAEVKPTTPPPLALPPSSALTPSKSEPIDAQWELLMAQSFSGDPHWITAKYNGHDRNGKRFKRGDRVLYFPRGKSIYTGPEADQAWAEFQAAAQDEAFYNGGNY